MTKKKNTILSDVSKSPSVELFIEAVQKKTSILVENLWDSPKALLAVLIQKVTGKHVLILSGKKEDRFLDSFPFFQTEILDFLAWETLPGEDIAPSLDISGKRLEILYKIATDQKPLIIHCPIQSLTQKTLSKKTLIPLCSLLQKGQEVPFDNLPDLLFRLGYKRCAIASDKGEFALRGGILDIFPIASQQPYRIDFFGDTIEGIRSYDPIGQKSIEKVDSVFLCPASEWSFLKEETDPFTLLDHLGPETVIIFDDLLTIENEYVSLRSLPGMQTRLLFPLEDLLKKLPDFTHLFFLEQKAEDLSEVILEDKKGRKFYSGKTPFQPISFEFFHESISTARWRHPFIEIPRFFSLFENKNTSTMEEIFHGINSLSKSALHLQFIVSGEAEEKTIQDQAKEMSAELPASTTFEKGYLFSGFALQDPLLAILPTPELTHRYKIRRPKWRNTYHTPASEFHQLSPGDTIVHLHSGIGKFLGTVTKQNHLGKDTEYLQVEYADNSALYVPLAQSHLISRYIGSGEEKPSLSTLGSSRWMKTCADAQTSILGYAKDLLQKAAERIAYPGFRYPEDSTYMQLFEEEFPFPETEDQLRAIDDIKKDMCSEKAMDRLICGDVGYGKTEVAMRAAFKAVCDGKKQVVVLVPTTVLALQHYESFKERMANFPVEVAVLCRFTPAKEAKEIIKRTKEGLIDILVGTHRLISKDIQFKDLGLLIIDEEQRFGVRAKEHIKARKASVDCLTLSATPIPRTLYMSLIGTREISEISTPPQDRLPIKSIIAEKDFELIKNAILREFSRDGQVFFIHNRVETLPRIVDDLQKLVPEAKIVMGHGQLDADEIDSVFHAFKTGEADILVSTTIIENGIDIPNANTIFIDRADMFGMADLYQLRGRVGRWNKPAFAYFLTPKNQTLAELPRKRLETLVESSGYGGGMKIALRDLEIRGAGDILGVQQSGQISAIGFHFYCKLLKKAIEALKKQEPIHFMETKMEFSFDAKLPESYINESSLRMELYYRLGNASSFLEVEDILKEITDRFGTPPKPVLLLCLMTRIKIKASALQITSMKFEKFTLQIEKVIGKISLKEIFPLPDLKNQATFEAKILEYITNWRPKPKGTP